MPRILYLPQ
ncbi:hypothetical protein V2J09_011738 [Rumex salicifolius]